MGAVSWVYLAFLFVWLGLNIFPGDRITLIALVNYLAVYLFFPLFFVLFTAIACKKRGLGIGFLFGVLAFAWLRRPQFTPCVIRFASDEPTLSVMIFNVLAWHEQVKPILDTVRAENPYIPDS